VIAAGQPIVRAEDLSVTYGALSGQLAVAALRSLSFSVQAGEFVAIIGRSGAGKTTLLRCLTGFVRPSAGRLIVNGLDVATARAGQLYRLRREVATVSQQLNLVERASALDNVLFGRLGYVGTLPSLLGWFPKRERRLAYATLAELGLAGRALQRADRLSGGERQRVAIARALVNRPELLLADEPTGNLDGDSATRVIELLESVRHDHGCTLVLVTHHRELAARADLHVALDRGRLVSAPV
jgi:phosphonate transport system ATP-binding protein